MKKSDIKERQLLYMPQIYKDDFEILLLYVKSINESSITVKYMNDNILNKNLEIDISIDKPLFLTKEEAANFILEHFTNKYNTLKNRLTNI